MCDRVLLMHRLVSLALTLVVLAMPLIVAALTAAPGGCGTACM
jgi:hypothetical protein